MRSANQDRARTGFTETRREDSLDLTGPRSSCHKSMESLKPISSENKVYLGPSLLCTAVVMGTTNDRASLTLFNHSRQWCSSTNNDECSKNHEV